MSNVTQQKFDANPKEGTYKRLAEYLVDSFVEDKLSEGVCHDLALATMELMQPMREYVRDRSLFNYLKAFFANKNIGKSMYALRLIPFGTDDNDVYNHLRQLFLDIKLPDKDQQLDQKKKILAGVLPYFVQYNADDEIKNHILEYYENTRSGQIDSLLQYFGGIEKFVDSFAGTLKDKEKRSKHWVYIWCFKVICMKDLIDNTLKNQLKKVIEAYKDNQKESITDFDEKIIEESLKC